MDAVFQLVNNVRYTTDSTLYVEGMREILRANTCKEIEEVFHPRCVCENWKWYAVKPNCVS